MNPCSVFDVLQEPLNLAHLEDRKAKSILTKDDSDYQGAIECHQRAHAHLRSVQMSIPARSLHEAKLVDEAFLTSLYGQMEYHILQQSILLNKQRRSVVKLKRQSYVASIREKTTELAVMKSLQRQKLHEQLNHQNDLLDSLKENLRNQSADAHASNQEMLPGWKKPKGLCDTVEELQNLTDQFRSLVSDLVNENMQLKNQLKATGGEQKSNLLQHDNSKHPNDTATNDKDVELDSMIYTLPQALTLAPLSQPPDFSVDDIDTSSELSSPSSS